MPYLALQLLIFPLFIILSALSIKFDHKHLRTAYTILAIWIGLLFYELLAKLVYTFVPHTPLLKWTLFILSILTAAYGVWNASRIRITHTSISLPHLPPLWKGRRAVLVSDIHLGHILTKHFATRVTRSINNLNPDIVFIAGDLYDGVKVDAKDSVEPLKELHPRLGTYFATGNHEEFFETGREHFIDAIKGAGIHVLQDEKVEVEGVQICGVDDRHSLKSREYKLALNKLALDKRTPSILLKHTPNLLYLTEEAGVTLELSGHTHKAQMWPLSYLTKWIFKGFDYGLQRYGLLQVLTSSGVGTWGPPLRVGTKAEVVMITFT